MSRSFYLNEIAKNDFDGKISRGKKFLNELKNDRNNCIDKDTKKVCDSMILFLLYEIKFYETLQSKDFSKCLKIIELSKISLNNIVVSEYNEFLNDRIYLSFMNTMKKRYDILLDYEKALKFLTN